MTKHLWDDAETGEPIYAPEYLNGYPVEKTEPHLNGWCTVMVHRPSQGDYVVATWTPAHASAWTWGHYDLTQSEAERVFYETCARNCQR